MALSLGVFARLFSWVTDRDNAVKIRADRMDAEFDGIATALSTAVYKDGQQTVTADLPMNTHKLTGLSAGSAAGHSVRWEQVLGSASVASATTPDIGAARYIHITGTVTITGFASAAASVWTILVFDGILTLTHNATSLILPSGVNITTAAGDVAVMVSEGSGNWKCASYSRATGGQVAGTRHVVKAAGTYTAAKTDHNQLWRCTGAVTINLTAAATLTDGWELWVFADGGDVTVDPNGAETIGGAGTRVVPNGSAALIICTGTTFYVMMAGFAATSGAFSPPLADLTALGTSALRWTNLFLAQGGAIDWNAGDVTVTHSANTLAFAGASSGYTFDALVKPSSNDGAALGASGTAWSDLFLATGGVLDFGAGNYTLTHSSGLLTASGSVMLTSTDAGATVGPILSLYRNSASPAASDIIGQIKFDGADSIGNQQAYADIFATISDATSGSEDATLTFRNVVAGTVTTQAQITSTGWNGMDIGVTTPGIGGFTTVSGTTGTFTGAVTAAGASPLTLTYVDAGATVGPLATLFRDSASPAASDQIGELRFDGRDSANNQQTYARIIGAITDATSTSEDGQILFNTTVAGTGTNVANLTGQGLEFGTYSAAGASNGAIVGLVGGTSIFWVSSTSSTGAITHSRFSNPNGVVGSIATSASTTAYNTSSDERLKELFETFDAGAFIDAIEVYRFAWKADGTIGYGVKAQAAQKVFPDAVTLGNDKEPGDEEFVPWAVDYSKFVPLLLKEVQALRKRVAVLEGA